MTDDFMLFCYVIQSVASVLTEQEHVPAVHSTGRRQNYTYFWEET